MAEWMAGGSSKACWKPWRPDRLRCFVIASGIIFALVFLAHVARVFAEGSGILREPMLISTSVLALGMAVWAAVLLTRRRS
jgi:hypothetical protein